jgi:SAM-dependent methyltransferase
VRPGFTKSVIESLLEQELVRTHDRILCTCAAGIEGELFRLLGFDSITLTNRYLDEDVIQTTLGLNDIEWVQADAQQLPFDDDSFDVAFVADGLHHCRSPHRAVTEMARVARRGVIVVETRDSLVMRLAVRARMSSDYEVSNRLLETRTSGGADFGPVPNFVYRWKEADFEKSVRCFQPEFNFDFRYFHGISVPPGNGISHRVIRTLGAAIGRAAPRQGNLFALCAFRRAGLQAYLERDADGLPVLAQDIRSARAALKRQTQDTRAHATIEAGFWDGWPANARDRIRAEAADYRDV